MQSKKIIYTFIRISMVFSLIYLAYISYDIQNNISAKNSSLYQMKENLGSFISYSLEQHYINTNEVHNKLSLFVIDSIGEFRVDEILLEDSFVILIPENTCEMCVEDIIDHVNQIFSHETEVYLLIEAASFKRVSIVKNNIANKSIKIVGFKTYGDSRLWHYDLPICFFYRNGRFLSPFIPIVEHSQRTVQYLE